MSEPIVPGERKLEVESKKAGGSMSGLMGFIERPGGEVLVAFALLGVGAGFWLWKIPKSEDLIVMGSTLIARAMIGQAVSK